MTEYKLLSRDSVKGLTEEVNQHLKQGWQVHGSPFVFGSRSAPEAIYQAVVREEEAIRSDAGKLATPTKVKK